MKLVDILLNRRSVRQYTDDTIPEETLNEILQAGLLAPSSRNIKPCEFYVVRDKAVLGRLSRAKAMGAAMLKDCSAAIAVMGNSEKADTWVEDCSIALSFMMLMAEEKEIGNCWCQIHLRSTAEGEDAEMAVREILNAEEPYRVVGILALGFPERKAPAHSLDEINWNKVHYR